MGSNYDHKGRKVEDCPVSSYLHDLSLKLIIINA